MSEVPSVPASAPAPSSAPAQEAQTQEQVSVAQQQQAEPSEAEKAAAKTPEQKAELKRKYDLKVNGKSKSVELDLSDDKSIQDYLQKAMAADEKFQEAASLRKDVQMLVKTLKENPLAILTHPDIGIDIKMLAQQVINQELEDMAKSPEQKRLEQLEKELEMERSAKKKIEEEKRAAELSKLEEAQMREIDSQITEALKKSSLPKVPYVVKRISDTMVQAFDAGYTDITVDQIVPIVEKQLQEEFGGYFNESSEEALEKLLGKNLDRLRKKRIAASKTAPTASAIKDTGSKAKPSAEKPSEEANKKRFEDMFGKF